MELEKENIKNIGPSRDSNPGPPAPKAGIIATRPHGRIIEDLPLFEAYKVQQFSTVNPTIYQNWRLTRHLRSFLKYSDAQNFLNSTSYRNIAAFVDFQL